MAQVQFSPGDLAEWMRRVGRSSVVEITDAIISAQYERMIEAETDREVRRALKSISDVVGLFGVEGLSLPEGEMNPTYAMSYVNTGETYDTTVVYDEPSSSFMLTSWGDWAEGVEQELAEERVEEADDRDLDICVSCGEQFPMDEMIMTVDPTSGRHEAQCRKCERENRPPPTWTPREESLFVASLRSVEGFLLAVHYIKPHPMNQPPHRTTLAFSVVLPDGRLIASQTISKYGDHVPYKTDLEDLVEKFGRQGAAAVFVANSAPQMQGIGSLDASIEREMFSRLQVAMDAFFDAGMERQPEKVFLKPPPVLWTCDQINEIAWSPDERGDGGGVQAFVRAHEPGSRFEFDDLVAWSAAGEELQSLIEDGFLKWEDDDTVREYLQHIGLCLTSR